MGQTKNAMSKKTLFSIILGVLFLTACPFVLVSARNLGNYGSSAFNIVLFMEAVKEAVWIIFGAVAVIMFVVAGIMFLTAQGDSEKLKTARSALIWGVAGVIIGIIAFSITSIVATFL